jgi:hypothetical protein
MNLPKNVAQLQRENVLFELRKDEVMQKRLRKFKPAEGVVFIGIAQEKANVPRTIRKHFGEGDGAIP